MAGSSWTVLHAVVDPDGALLLEMGGVRQRIVSGEVSVRPVRE
jgi:hypothetical protein